MRDISCGTTLVAIQYKDGVVIAADGRTSAGQFVMNRVQDKLTPITNHIYCCRSGNAADTNAIADVVRFRVKLLALELGEEPTVELVAQNFKNIIYQNREQVEAGIIVAGWDKKKGGQVYSANVTGMIIQEKYSLGGSGSGYIFGYIDSNYKENMTKEEADNLALNAVTQAIKRDGSSGGCVRIASITKDGCSKRTVLYNDLPQVGLY